MGRVLILEDHVGVRAMLQRMFENLGHEVAAVAALSEARDAWRAAPPDVVILDLVLDAGEDGVTLLRERAAEKLPPVPVIVLSGAVGRLRALEDDEAEALGVCARFRKPADLNDLVAAADAILRGEAPPSVRDATS